MAGEDSMVFKSRHGEQFEWEPRMVRLPSPPSRMTSSRWAIAASSSICGCAPPSFLLTCSWQLPPPRRPGTCLPPSPPSLLLLRWLWKRGGCSPPLLLPYPLHTDIVHVPLIIDLWNISHPLDTTIWTNHNLNKSFQSCEPKLCSCVSLSLMQNCPATLTVSLTVRYTICIFLEPSLHRYTYIIGYFWTQRYMDPMSIKIYIEYCYLLQSIMLPL